MPSTDQVYRELARSEDRKLRAGLYQGEVENIDDPKRLGRVQIRIHVLHGDNSATPLKALPWATVSYPPGGGAHDTGEADGPIVGASVHVMFIHADENYPVVVGSWRGHPKRSEFLTVRGEEIGGDSPWVREEGGNELPSDVFEGKEDEDNHPTKRVWKKSFKGHTIVVEEKDGAERLQIIDRAGQIIDMYCPVAPDSNKGNAEQRGTRNAADGTQLPFEAMADVPRISIIDLSGQEIRLTANAGKEKLELINRTRQGGQEQRITMDLSDHGGSVSITDNEGNQVKLAGRGDQPILLQDTKGNKIAFDKVNNEIIIDSTGASRRRIATDDVHEIGGDLIQNVGGSVLTSIEGAYKLATGGDHSWGLGGSFTGIIGGAYGLTIANVPLGLTPQALAYYVRAVTGSLELSTKLGDIKLSTLIGLMSLVTQSGIAEFGTRLGASSLFGGPGGTSGLFITLDGTLQLLTPVGVIDITKTGISLTAPIVDIKAASINLTGAVDIKGAFNVKGPSILTGPTAIVGILTSLFAGNPVARVGDTIQGQTSDGKSVTGTITSGSSLIKTS